MDSGLCNETSFRVLVHYLGDTISTQQVQHHQFKDVIIDWLDAALSILLLCAQNVVQRPLDELQQLICYSLYNRRFSPLPSLLSYRGRSFWQPLSTLCLLESATSSLSVAILYLPGWLLFSARLPTLVWEFATPPFHGSGERRVMDMAQTGFTCFQKRRQVDPLGLSWSVSRHFSFSDKYFVICLLQAEL